MNFSDVVDVVVVLVWVTVLCLQMYRLGLDKGERYGRMQGCRCRRGEGSCPCQHKGAQ
jgi:hypothetical protein